MTTMGKWKCPVASAARCGTHPTGNELFGGQLLRVIRRRGTRTFVSTARMTLRDVPPDAALQCREASPCSVFANNTR